MAVRSKRLAAGTVTTAGTGTLYTVPAGYRTIIKGISAYNEAASFNHLYLQVELAGSALAILTVALAATGGLDDERHLTPFQVMNAGEYLIAGADHNSVAFVVSGAELLL